MPWYEQDLNLTSGSSLKVIFIIIGVTCVFTGLMWGGAGICLGILLGIVLGVVVAALGQAFKKPRASLDCMKIVISATKMGDYDLVRSYVEDNPQYLNVSDDYGRTLLHIAAEFGQAGVAEYLLSKGVAPGTKDHQGNTPADIARGKGFNEIEDLLFKAMNSQPLGRNTQHGRKSGLDTDTGRHHPEWQDAIRGTFVGRQIRISARNRLIASFFLIVILLGFAWRKERYFYNFFFGPFLLSQQEVYSISSPKDIRKYFVTVKGEEIVDTGIRQITCEVSERTNEVVAEKETARYMVLVVGEKLLVVEAQATVPGSNVTGRLVNLPSDIAKNIIQSLSPGMPEDYRRMARSSMNKILVPAMLEVGNFRTPGYWGLAIGLFIFLIVFTSLVKAILFRRHPWRHPVWRCLRKYGEPNAVAHAIEAEISSAPAGVPIGPILVTRSWLLLRFIFGPMVLKLTDIVWAYKKVHQLHSYWKEY